MWNSVYKEDELKNCSNQINFAELGTIFESEHAKRDDNSFILANLIVGILKNGALPDGADKRLCPYNMDIFAQIDDAEIKLSVLKGLLEFGRLFMETFGIFAIEHRFLGDWRTMLWNNVPITFASYERPEDEMGAIRKSLEKAGLIEAMGDEIVKNRDNQLAKAGVKRKNISRLN
uniref:Uncharacterized protein n=1 Tax=Globodera rostochiensis TaxID=31243 RepID=A0A914HP53_GLORO